MEYSYLNIFPSQRVAKQIELEDQEFQLTQKVIKEAEDYVKSMEKENLKYLKSRKSSDLNPKDTYKFLRSQERIRNTKLILQYLTTFLTSYLPFDKELESKPVNPFEQLKQFAIHNIQLIKEKDVSAAILKEHEQRGLLTDTNLWYYRGQIDKSYKTIREAFEDAKSATLDDYRKIFMGLQLLCTFWFSVRNEEINRVRKSDILVYKLTRYLLHKYK